jgi:hypothetical protein
MQPVGYQRTTNQCVNKTNSLLQQRSLMNARKAFWRPTRFRLGAFGGAKHGCKLKQIRLISIVAMMVL